MTSSHVKTAALLAVEALEPILRELIAEHERLLTATIDHRRALSQADLPALNACINRQNECVQRIATIERRRADLMARVRVGPAPGPGEQPLTVSSLARSAPEPTRSRLLGLGGTLRDLLNRLHREHTSLRLAAETLASHVDGLMRQVCRQLSHAGTYARSGSVDSGVPVVTGLDVRT